MLYIVVLDVPVEQFRAALGAAGRVVRELPPGRVVVEAEDASRLTALTGVRAVFPDSLQHPDAPSASP